MINLKSIAFAIGSIGSLAMMPVAASALPVFGPASAVSAPELVQSARIVCHHHRCFRVGPRPYWRHHGWNRGYYRGWHGGRGFHGGWHGRGYGRGFHNVRPERQHGGPR